MLRRIRHVLKSESGFTLIELLIVIVILGILAAVVVFAVGAFTKNGQQAACQADFKSVEIADEAYYASHNNQYAVLPSGGTNPLVPTYLKEWPSSTSYSISLPATDTTQGPTVTITTGGATSTDDSACSNLSK